MKKRISMSLAGLLLFFVLSVPAYAANWETDNAHSNFYFTVDHIFSKVRGFFADYTADIVFDPEKPEAAKFVFVIKTDSVDTNIAKRDKHLQSPDFFDAATFPEMKFTSTSVKDLGSGRLEVIGRLAVKGAEHDIVLPLVFAGIKDHPAAKGKKVIGFNGTVVLDRLKLGVGSGKFFDMGVVGKDVELLVTLEAFGD